MTEQPFRPRPGLAEVARAEQARAVAAARRQPRRGNDPYRVAEEYSPRTYSDPTADEAIGNVDRERARAEAAPRPPALGWKYLSGLNAWRTPGGRIIRDEYLGVHGVGRR